MVVTECFFFSPFILFFYDNNYFEKTMECVSRVPFRVCLCTLSSSASSSWHFFSIANWFLLNDKKEWETYYYSFILHAQHDTEHVDSIIQKKKKERKEKNNHPQPASIFFSYQNHWLIVWVWTCKMIVKFFSLVHTPHCCMILYWEDGGLLNNL